EAKSVLVRERTEKRLERRQGADDDRRQSVGQHGLRAWHHERRIEAALNAEARARRAGAVRTVEREEAGCELGVGNPARRAGMSLAEEERAGGLRSRLDRLDQHGPASVGEADRERVGEPGLDAWAEDEPIDQHLDRVTRRTRED